MSKPKLSLFPRNALWLASEVLTEGEKKHPKFGWRDGSHTITSLLDKVLRHTMNFIDGNDFDEDSGSLNLAHAAADLALAIDLYVTRKDLDDRYSNNSIGIPDKTVGSDVDDINLLLKCKDSPGYNLALSNIAKQSKKSEEEKSMYTYPNSPIDEQINAIINDYDVDSDNNTGEVIMMQLKAGMAIHHPDGKIIPILTDGSFRVSNGCRIDWN